jgi:periplasmic divalent cation tolerance protein
MDAIAVYITAKDTEQARNIGRVLVEERLAACVNITGPIRSIYRWEGAVCEDGECVLIAKTRQPLLTPLIGRVKELHTYTCPCIVAFPITGGNNDFLKWIAAETGA